jgi:hypothetical protein
MWSKKLKNTRRLRHSNIRFLYIHGSANKSQFNMEKITLKFPTFISISNSDMKENQVKKYKIPDHIHKSHCKMGKNH